MQDFKKLEVWSKAHELALEIYRLTEKFPKHEVYGLTSQMRRSATSVPTKIAEGCCRDSSPDSARFLQIAIGSAGELEYQLLLACDLGYLPAEQVKAMEAKTISVKMMLTNLTKRVRAACA